jgi:pyruvate dehydrogenase E1 component beta subunit
LFAHVPGLKVVMPTTPADVKGLTIASIQDENPVIILEHRWLYGRKGHVPAEPYSIPLGKGAIAREGSDVTVVAFSLMAEDALEAASLLEEEGIGIEVIDLRTVRPWDEEIVFQSAAKTGRLLVLDGGWQSFGVSAEIAARAGEELWGSLKAPPRRVALPDTPTPCSPVLEAAYYPGPEDIATAVRELLQGGEPKVLGKGDEKESTAAAPGVSDPKFQGPF